MSDLDAWLRLMPKDAIWRPKEAFWLPLLQLTMLLNRGMIEVREVDGREFYRVVQHDQG